MEGNSYYLKGEERFGRCSSKFYSRLSGLHYWKYYSAIVKEILKHSPQTVLDVGCGPGDVLTHIASESDTIQLYGIDPSESMVEAASRKFEKNGFQDRVKVSQGSSREVPFQLSFDLIISTFSFHHWKEQESSLENLSRYLSEKGRIIIFDLDRNQYPGKLPLLRRHSLSESFCRNLHIKGLSGEISHIWNSGLISYSLHPEQPGGQVQGTYKQVIQSAE